jgi:pimeloyl-ACP methyl ester carboxylesterase
MRRTLVAAAAVLLALTACDAGERSEPPGAGPEESGNVKPGLSWGECPGGVAVALTAKNRCGTLTVPVDHRAPGPPALSLDVVQIWPASDEQATDVAVSVGFNFGEPAQAPGLMATLADRLGVAVVQVAPRGVGEAGGAALDCPEVDEAPAGPAELDSAGRQTFLAAVSSCRERLADVDLSAFGADDLAGDLEALRVAMDVDQWYALVAYGEMVRVSQTYSSSYGERVRAIVADSPPPADRDVLSAGPEGTRSALAALFDECRDDRRCNARYPDLERAWEDALERTARSPISGNGADGEVVVDAPKLLRAVRAVLGGDGPALVADLPRVIMTAAQGKVHPTLAGVVNQESGYCNGYRPVCTKPGFSMGAYLSVVCPELGAGDETADDDPLYRGVFSESPYVDACEIWDVPAAAPAADSAVPTLVLTGHLDSWSRAEWFEDAVVVRGATHDTAGSSLCPLEVRKAWLRDPSREPDPTSCQNAPFPHWD